MNKDSYTIYGGSWYDYQALARAVYRNGVHPVNRSAVVGFRAVEEVMCMVRGGAWALDAANARAACRYYIRPGGRGGGVGFRTVEEEVKE